MLYNFNLFNYKNYLLSKKIKWIFEIEEYEIISNKISLKYEIKNYIIFTQQFQFLKDTF